MMKNNLVLLVLCIFIFLSGSIIYAFESDKEYQYLDQIALRAGTDKGTAHNYTEIYAAYLAPLRDKSIKFLEIGIASGASVKMWEEYLQNAELHFMDITLQHVKHFSDRSHYHLCDQESPEELQNFVEVTGGGFDVIIDDGGHTMTQQITSFTSLFPYVKSGGMYIIEDLHTSYWSKFGGGGGDSTINFLKSLVDDINFVSATTGYASHLNISPEIKGKMNLYQEKIKSIHFYSSLAIIFKR